MRMFLFSEAYLSEVRIVMVYDVDCRGSIPCKVMILFSAPQLPGLLWVYTTYFSVGIGGSFAGVKLPGREAEHSLQSSAEINNGGVTPPVLHTSSLHSA
jgi:hypothetical protein